MRALTLIFLFGCSESTTRDDAGPDADRDAGMDARTDAGRDAGPPPCEPACESTCEEAAAQSSNYGCEFYVVDLDNAAIDAMRDASSQPFAIVIANSGLEDAAVTVERNTAAFGMPAAIETLMTATIPPRVADTLVLGRFEVDGSSGLGDGTHTALSAAALRVTSDRPVAVYQLNPQQNSGAFSNDGSLVLPVHLLGTRYRVVAWPQTVADSDVPEEDLGLDLRAFLTIVGTAPAHVEVTLGARVRRVMGAGAIPESGPGDTISVDLAPYEVLNLETGGFNADFTGSLVVTGAPVAVFVGSEGSNVPYARDVMSLSCCGDHLEGQLAPDDRQGRRFVIARTPPRAPALNAAFVDPSEEIPETNEPEWVRAIAVEPGTTTITTTLAPPNDRFELAEGEIAEIEATEDFELNADRRVSVIQLLASQVAAGIPQRYPGGDPSLIAVPPVEAFRAYHAFAVPDLYAFDFLTIVAPVGAEVRLDGAALPSTCASSAIGADFVGYRCQLGFPEVDGLTVTAGTQDDGFHTVESDRRVGVIVSGFDAFVSYAFAAGANYGRF